MAFCSSVQQLSTHGAAALCADRSAFPEHSASVSNGTGLESPAHSYLRIACSFPITTDQFRLSLRKGASRTTGDLWRSENGHTALILPLLSRFSVIWSQKEKFFYRRNHKSIELKTRLLQESSILSMLFFRNKYLYFRNKHSTSRWNK